MTAKPLIRCAVYTRKSHEEGLEQEYNSLDAQYDASVNYIQSQRHEGWVLTAERYDDGGYTGGNLERPALKRLLADIQRGMIDVVVVYKIDRLSRSLMDFSRLVELFDKHKVTFVSVTQHFNTTTSMGRLTLNILLSFAQFEREITGERIRDKIAASKAKGMWTGGYAPIGYDMHDKKLSINEPEAQVVRFIFDEFVKHGSPTLLFNELVKRNWKTKEWTSSTGKSYPGKKIDKGLIYRILHNPIYVGKVRHKDKIFDGQHEALISEDIWEQAQRMLTVDPRQRAAKNRQRLDFILRGILFDGDGRAMTPTYTRRQGSKLYRYYVSTRAIKEGYASCDLKRIGAEEIEKLVIAQAREMVSTPEMIYRTHELAQKADGAITIGEVQAALAEFNGLWDQLYPVEKNRLIHLLIERITITRQGMQICYQANGLLTIYNEMKMQREVA